MPNQRGSPDAPQENNEQLINSLARVCLSVRRWIEKHPGSYLHKVQNVWNTLSPAEKIAFMDDKSFLSEAAKESLPIYNIFATHKRVKNALHVRKSETEALTIKHVDPFHIKLFASLGIFDCPENALFLEDEITNLKQVLTLLGTLSAFIPGLGIEIKALITQATAQAENLAMKGKTVLPKVRRNVRKECSAENAGALTSIQNGVHAAVAEKTL